MGCDHPGDNTSFFKLRTKNPEDYEGKRCLEAERPRYWPVYRILVLDTEKKLTDKTTVESPEDGWMLIKQITHSSEQAKEFLSGSRRYASHNCRW